MSHRSVSAPRVAALALALLLGLSAAAVAGPPWISVEIPANPNLREARDAMLLVRAYHHSEERAFRVTGVAEGVVDGVRVSHPLVLRPTSKAGVHAVVRPDLEDGRWVLVLTLEGGETDATALVTLDRAGEVAGVDVPVRGRAEGFTFPRAATEAEVEALLDDEGLAEGGPGAVPLVAAIGLAALAIAWPWARRRR